MRITFAVLAGLVALMLPGTAAAAPPTNDAFGSAAVVGSLPYSDVVNTTDSTIEGGEPQFCIFMNQTVWYLFTPATNSVVAVNNGGTGFQTNVNVYRSVGPGITSLNFLGCSQNGSSVTFQAEAGQTYYIQAGILFGSVGDLHLNVDEVPPPANDDFVDATVVPSLPFNNTVDTSGAGTESGEPQPSCVGGLPTGTVWYAFTPSTSGSISARATGGFSTALAAYTGSGPGNLNEVRCRIFNGLLTMHVDAGTTYYFQAGGLFGGRGNLQFTIVVAPPPVANISLFPGDPSSFDTVQFFSSSFDPGEVGIESMDWTFGDGGTANGCCPTHRYFADGNYTVGLTVTTFDGRTASTETVVQVRTHDVAITKLQVPQSGNVGQTRQVSVGLSNKRYGETVQVQLFKSGPGGYEFVGVLTQSVPIRSGGRTTDFKFSYTFTSADAAIGKVTFKAVATLVNARDAAPADNEAISLPTKVNG